MNCDKIILERLHEIWLENMTEILNLKFFTRLFRSFDELGNFQREHHCQPVSIENYANQRSISFCNTIFNAKFVTIIRLSPNRRVYISDKTCGTKNFGCEIPY